MERKKEKILVAMSGGVDSSVAAGLLTRAGYDVTGAYMVNYEETNLEDKAGLLGVASAKPCWTNDYRDALRVAAKLGVPLLKLNFIKEYKKYVLDYMFNEYKKGNTPNPDILCNKYIKFGFWLKKAKQLGFSKLATGHYARLAARKQENKKARKQNVVYELYEAKDKNKDQTYFLNQLTQKQLKDVSFPIGEYTKPQVRKLAKKLNLPVAEKEESMGICFVGEVPMKDFLSKKIKSKPGNVVLSSGEIIGTHDGLAFYTIGQRHIGIKNYKLKIKNLRSEPLYVLGKNIKMNELIVGHENDPLLCKKKIEIRNVNWIIGHKPDFPIECKVRLRHRQPLQKCSIKHKASSIYVEFETQQRALAQGQFAVFYLADEASAKSDKSSKCLGGGIIC